MYRTIPLVLLLSSCAALDMGECLKWTTREYTTTECAGYGASTGPVCVDTTYYEPYCLVRKEET